MKGANNMKRVYKPQTNVYEASQERLAFVFNNFEKVYISFSGGKDSGVLLNLCLDYMKKHNIKKKLGVQIFDNEANYEMTMDFMQRIIDNNLEYLDVYWCCLPISLPCTVSSYEIEWQAWGVNDEHRWVRPMPDMKYILNMENHPFGDKFIEDMLVYDFWDMFAEWYSAGKTTANLIGIRTQESLNRYRAILNEDKQMFDSKPWTKKNTKNVYNVYPIYDWKTRDIWISTAKFDWDYNKLYDTFYMAGVPIERMRVASPFMSESKASLNLYRVIDGHTWSRLCARVAGANFIATYGKQLNYHSFKLPDGHTWKSFVKFLLDTLPDESSINFKSRFIQSIRYWARVGRGLPVKVVQDLENNNVKFYVNGVTAHGKNNLPRIRIPVPPDHLDCLESHNSEVTSWKRFAITILKNDHTCKYMGLAPTKHQQQRQKQIQRKYSSIEKG